MWIVIDFSWIMQNYAELCFERAQKSLINVIKYAKLSQNCAFESIFVQSV